MTPPGCARQQPACQAAELPGKPILSRTAAATQDPIPAGRRVYQSLSHCTQCTTAGRPPPPPLHLWTHPHYAEITAKYSPIFSQSLYVFSSAIKISIS